MPDRPAERRFKSFSLNASCSSMDHVTRSQEEHAASRSKGSTNVDDIPWARLQVWIANLESFFFLSGGGDFLSCVLAMTNSRVFSLLTFAAFSTRTFPKSIFYFENNHAYACGNHNLSNFGLISHVYLLKIDFPFDLIELGNH
jgi:hypothetical protein